MNLKTRAASAVAGVVAAVALTACGGGNGGSSAAVQATAQAASAAPAIPTIAQAASAIGATHVGTPYLPKRFASQYADATWHGHRITIATFASPALESAWVSLAGLAGPIVAQGSLYAAVEIAGR
jgi:hypothetical protein